MPFLSNVISFTGIPFGSVNLMYGVDENESKASFFVSLILFVVELGKQKQFCTLISDVEPRILILEPLNNLRGVPSAENSHTRWDLGKGISTLVYFSRRLSGETLPVLKPLKTAYNWNFETSTSTSCFNFLSFFSNKYDPVNLP